MSDQEGLLPHQWLNSIIVPIFKKSSRYNPLNYRPVSITSVPCKVLERLIVVHLNEYLDMNRIISDEQFGFRAAHSTQDQLLLTYDEISISIDKGQIVDLIFFYFAKAFDKVCHKILLFKLLELGISAEILRWICGFLSNRVMKVRVAGACSYTDPVTSGVPQGSVLVPVLFIDDIKLYLGFERGNIADGVHKCQDDIDKLVRTSESWGLLLNVEKCAVVRFAPRNGVIQMTGVSPFCVNYVCLYKLLRVSLGSWSYN